ncbi:hypothetical protein LCGC14_2612870, partial [marine sediment metagenome]
MARIGLAGGTYQSQSPNASADFTMNFYPEFMESENPKSRIVLYPTPGLSLFTALTGASVRGIIKINARCFAVAGTTLYEIKGDGTNVTLGTVVNDGLPASMVASTIELLIASGGTVYVLTLATNVLTTIPSGTLTNVSVVVYIDGFFLALNKGTQIFRISAPLDGTSWPGGQVIQVSVFPDNVVSMIDDHRELWLFGVTQSVVYSNTGSAAIFDVINGSVLQTGSGAVFSVANLDNTIFWLGGDEKGPAMVWRAAGYTPQRVSNHAIELAIESYTTTSDAIAYPYVAQGHAFYVLYFPTADKTWVYDVATDMWAERGFLKAGQFEAHHSRCHTHVFNKHLVGDWDSGNVYEMSIDHLDDNGSPLRRVRRAPHLSEENKWAFHSFLQVDVETGLGPTPPLLD